jgi:ribosomal protein L21E
VNEMVKPKYRIRETKQGTYHLLERFSESGVEHLIARSATKEGILKKKKWLIGNPKIKNPTITYTKEEQNRLKLFLKYNKKWLLKYAIDKATIEDLAKAITIHASAIKRQLIKDGMDAEARKWHILFNTFDRKYSIRFPKIKNPTSRRDKYATIQIGKEYVISKAVAKRPHDPPAGVIVKVLEKREAQYTYNIRVLYKGKKYLVSAMHLLEGKRNPKVAGLDKIETEMFKKGWHIIGRMPYSLKWKEDVDLEKKAEEIYGKNITKKWIGGKDYKGRELRVLFIKVKGKNPQIKVGDKVKIGRAVQSYYKPYIGQIGTVITARPGDMTVEIEMPSGKKIWTWDVEKVKKPKVKKNPEGVLVERYEVIDAPYPLHYNVYKLKEGYFKVTTVDKSGEYRIGYTSSPIAMIKETAKGYKIKKVYSKKKPRVKHNPLIEFYNHKFMTSQSNRERDKYYKLLNKEG